MIIDRISTTVIKNELQAKEQQISLKKITYLKLQYQHLRRLQLFHSPSDGTPVK